MFNLITWGKYFSIVALLLVFYYLFVGIKYFRWEILGLTGIKKVDNDVIAIPPGTNTKSEENHDHYLPKPLQNKSSSLMVQPFTDELQAYLNQTENGISKHELFDGLQQLLEKYPVTKNAEYRNELTYFIATAVNTKYPQLLQANNIAKLWN